MLRDSYCINTVGATAVPFYQRAREHMVLFYAHFIELAPFSDQSGSRFIPAGAKCGVGRGKVKSLNADSVVLQSYCEHDCSIIPSEGPRTSGIDLPSRD